MKSSTLTILVVTLAAAACGLVVAVVLRALEPPPEKQGPLPRAERGPFAYRVLGELHHRQFNVRMSLSRVQGTAPTVRLLLNQQDPANYYFVEFGDRETRIGKVQHGMKVPIGTRGGGVLALGTPCEVMVKRRELDLEVYANRVPIATASDDTFSGGKVLLGQLGESVSVDAFRLQPVGDLLFADDFMKAATTDGQWSAPSGEWKVVTLKNPGLSSNAFYFVGTAAEDPAVAATGHWFWDEYAFQISCRPMGSKAIRVLAYYGGPDDNYAFRWSRAEGRAGGGKKQLIRRSGGKEMVLRETGGGYLEGQWYRLLIAVRGNQITASIDGNTVFKVRDGALNCGKIGLATEGPGSSFFDDVYVVNDRSFVDSFEEPCPGRWLELGGTWVSAGGETGRMAAQADGPAKIISGAERWRGYRCSVDLAEWGRGSVGLCAYYQGEGDYYLLQWRPGQRKVLLSAMAGGAETVLSEKGWEGPKAYPCRFSLDLGDGLIRGYAGGQLLVDAVRQIGPTNGRIGLFAENADAGFDDVRVTFHSPPEPVLTVNEVFAGENSMAEWSRSESDWIAHHSDANPAAGPEHEAEAGEEPTALHHYWHRVDFIGDCEAEASLRGQDEPAVEGGRYAVTLAGDGESEHSGYTLTLQSGTSPALSLRRKGKVVSQERMAASKANTIKLSRVGRYAIGYIDGRRALSFRDPEPLAGQRVAFSTDRERFDTDNLTVYSPNLYS